MPKKKKNEVALLDTQNYPMLLEDVNEVMESLQANFEGEQVSRRDVFKEIPNQKGEDFWTIETPDGKNTYDELTGIILHVGSNRVLFEGKYSDGGSSIPLCTSDDGAIGDGKPGGSCRDCDEKDFGPNGETPNCMHRKPIYALIPEINPVLPVVFNITGTSFPSLKKHRSFCAQYGIKFWDSEIKFTLNPTKTKNNKEASILTFEIVSNVKKTNPEAYQKIVEFRKAFLPYMRPDSMSPPAETQKAA